jgi:hypothetical protein
MEQKLNLLNKLLLSLLLIGTLMLLVNVVYWLPKVAESTKRLNVAECLESYNNQGQPPLGACGFDFQ